ncbi:hypothetical protein [Aliikangiella coralliicola]|uniref:Uncharacterized protein n=1 Tax=Aliikangiella coralliicola TaxID=2592383 RepID=A0A545UHM0_9GAMM|nr:hypothetical protein [Aliikangiella coralliicola]TQV88960.1 hypothetical protein FLL46_05360 [Aliikangiella coralliicola]
MSNKRSRLTRQQWLNLIIISVSAMLLLSVLVGRLISNSTVDSASPSQVPRLTEIDFGDIQLRFVSESWQVVSSKKISIQQAKIIGENWQALLLSRSQPLKSGVPGGKTVLLYLSTLNQPVVSKVSYSDKQMLVTFASTSQQFSIPYSERINYMPELSNQK